MRPYFPLEPPWLLVQNIQHVVWSLGRLKLKISHNLVALPQGRTYFHVEAKAWPIRIFSDLEVWPYEYQTHASLPLWEAHNDKCPHIRKTVRDRHGCHKWWACKYQRSRDQKVQCRDVAEGGNKVDGVSITSQVGSDSCGWHILRYFAPSHIVFCVVSTQIMKVPGWNHWDYLLISENSSMGSIPRLLPRQCCCSLFGQAPQHEPTMVGRMGVKAQWWQSIPTFITSTNLAQQPLETWHLSAHHPTPPPCPIWIRLCSGFLGNCLEGMTGS